MLLGLVVSSASIFLADISGFPFFRCQQLSTKLSWRSALIKCHYFVTFLTSTVCFWIRNHDGLSQTKIKTFKVSNIQIEKKIMLHHFVDNGATKSICPVLAKIVFYQQGVHKRVVDDNTNSDTNASYAHSFFVLTGKAGPIHRVKEGSRGWVISCSRMHNTSR